MRDLDVGYLGIEVDDRDPQAIFDDMVEGVQAELPAWAPHNAALEVMILEAFAVAAADWIYATNRTTGALVETVLTLYGVPRDDGLPASGQLELTFDGSVSLSIAEGAAFVTDEGVTLVAVRDTLVDGSSATLDVEEATAGEGSLLVAGAELSPAVAIPRLSTCQLVAPVAGGRPAEDDLTYLARAATRLRRVTSALVVPEHFTAAALEDPRVGRATTLDRYNGTTPDVDGHVTVVLYGRGEALPADTIEELRLSMEEASASILTVHAMPAELVPVDITAGITVATGYDSTDTVAQAEAVLTEWLSWPNAGFGQTTVDPDIIETILADIPGVSAAVVSAPSGGLTFEPWQLPAPGAINVTA